MAVKKESVKPVRVRMLRDIFFPGAKIKYKHSEDHFYKLNEYEMSADLAECLIKKGALEIIG